MTPAEFRAARQALRMTVIELAYALSVHPRTVRRWQNGSTPVPGVAAVALRGLLGAFQARTGCPADKMPS